MLAIENQLTNPINMHLFASNGRLQYMCVHDPPPQDSSGSPRLANIAEAIYEPEFDMIADSALWNAVLLLLESFASNLTKPVPSRKDKRAENRALRPEREHYVYRYRQDT
jgi:hypothetical protein